MSMLASSQMDVGSVAQALLQDTSFLTALAHNDTFVSELSQNDKFVSSLSNNTVFIDGIKDHVTEELDNSFEGKLSHSTFHPIQRIFEIETFVGTDGFNSCENVEDEHKLSLAKRIQTLETKLENYTPRPTVTPDINQMYDSDTEKRAACLVDAIVDSEKGFFTASEIIEFLKFKLPDYCKLDDTVQNIRKVKQDVVNKAEQMFSYVKKNKKEYGHREVRLVCNPA